MGRLEHIQAVRYPTHPDTKSELITRSYDQLSSRMALSSSPEFVWCLDCDSGQIHADGAQSPIVEYHGCQAYSCFTHRTPCHYGLTCNEYDVASRSRRARVFLNMRHRSKVFAVRLSAQAPEPSRPFSTFRNCSINQTQPFYISQVRNFC
jgi:hypothetical protein